MSDTLVELLRALGALAMFAALAYGVKVVQTLY